MPLLPLLVCPTRAHTHEHMSTRAHEYERRLMRMSSGALFSLQITHPSSNLRLPLRVRIACACLLPAAYHRGDVDSGEEVPVDRADPPLPLCRPRCRVVGPVPPDPPSRGSRRGSRKVPHLSQSAPLRHQLFPEHSAREAQGRRRCRGRDHLGVPSCRWRRREQRGEQREEQRERALHRRRGEDKEYIDAAGRDTALGRFGRI